MNAVIKYYTTGNPRHGVICPMTANGARYEPIYILGKLAGVHVSVLDDITDEVVVCSLPNYGGSLDRDDLVFIIPPQNCNAAFTKLVDGSYLITKVWLSS